MAGDSYKAKEKVATVFSESLKGFDRMHTSTTFLVSLGSLEFVYGQDHTRMFIYLLSGRLGARVRGSGLQASISFPDGPRSALLCRNNVYQQGALALDPDPILWFTEVM